MKYRSNGKLLITGEYVVLNGARALALPTKLGQSLSFNSAEGFHWKSIDHQKGLWFECELDPDTLEILSSSDEEIAFKLVDLLRAARELSPVNESFEGVEILTELDFPRNWGLGSSSTLISNVAAWLQIDPLKLHFSVSQGSGYDIAAAITEGPLLYERLPEPSWLQIPFEPAYRTELHFIYLNRKANSEFAVANYSAENTPSDDVIDRISNISLEIVQRPKLEGFEALIDEHEELISNVLQQKTIKETLFPDFPGSIKSLGAWGGDFVLATGSQDAMSYFKDKGYETILSYDELILS